MRGKCRGSKGEREVEGEGDAEVKRPLLFSAYELFCIFFFFCSFLRTLAVGGATHEDVEAHGRRARERDAPAEHCS